MSETMASDAPESSAPTSQPLPEASESSAAGAPAGVPPSSSAPVAEQFDPRAAYETLNQQIQQYQQHYAGEAKQRQEWQQKMQDLWMQTLAPQEYEKQRQPRYITAEQFETQMRQHSAEVRATALAERFQGELDSAREKYAEVFTDIPQAEDIVKAMWVKDTKSSVAQIVKSLGDMLGKTFDRRQAAYLAAKDKTAAETGGTIRSGGGSSQASGSFEKPNGAKKLRGFARIRAAVERAGTSD